MSITVLDYVALGFKPRDSDCLGMHSIMHVPSPTACFC